MRFDHVGLPTTEKKLNESLYEPNRVWITDAQIHPYRVEWLRYEDDSEVPASVREFPHIGYVVDSIEEKSGELTMILEPFVVGDRRVGFFATEDGVVIELIELLKG